MARATRRPQTDSRADESTITSLVWLELRGMLTHLREGQFQRGEKAPTLEQFFEGHGYYADSKPQTAGGWLKSDVGTCGRHVLWIRQETNAHEEGVQEDGDAVQPQTVPVVEMIKLPFIGGGFDEETTSNSLRRLQVPLDINKRMALVRFCDEWGMLGYMNNSTTEEQNIHIFDY
ncbi:hypothetical protein FS837_010182 [Tulasnella sp. UAMH 9824]|nr:hypothetical protein FS837_010182 [Tulasnella sp. UAMH 9824]